MSLSDRIAVMYKGRILGTLDAAAATREQLGLLMAGVTQEGVHAWHPSARVFRWWLLTAGPRPGGRLHKSSDARRQRMKSG